MMGFCIGFESLIIVLISLYECMCMGFVNWNIKNFVSLYVICCVKVINISCLGFLDGCIKFLCLLSIEF